MHANIHRSKIICAFQACSSQFQPHTVKRHGFYLCENRVAGRINSFATDFAFKPFIADFNDFELPEQSVFGDMAVIKFREPLHHERRAVAGLDTNATYLQESDRIHVRDQREHSSRSAGKQHFRIWSSHQDPSVPSVIYKVQPMRHLAMKIHSVNSLSRGENYKSLRIVEQHEPSGKSILLIDRTGHAGCDNYIGVDEAKRSSCLGYVSSNLNCSYFARSSKSSAGIPHLLVVFDCAIKIHELRPRGLQPLQHHLPDAHGQFVTETVIRFSILTQDGRGESHRFGGGMGACAEMPAIRREEPRPAERFAGSNRFNRDHAFASHEGSVATMKSKAAGCDYRMN